MIITMHSIVSDRIWSYSDCFRLLSIASYGNDGIMQTISFGYDHAFHDHDVLNGTRLYSMIMMHSLACDWIGLLSLELPLIAFDLIHKNMIEYPFMSLHVIVFARIWLHPLVFNPIWQLSIVFHHFSSLVIAGQRWSLLFMVVYRSGSLRLASFLRDSMISTFKSLASFEHFPSSPFIVHPQINLRVSILPSLSIWVFEGPKRHECYAFWRVHCNSEHLRNFSLHMFIFIGNFKETHEKRNETIIFGTSQFNVQNATFWSWSHSSTWPTHEWSLSCLYCAMFLFHR